MAQHFLIASSTSKYIEERDNRPALPKVVEDIVQLFTKSLGVYERQLDVIGENPTSAALTTQLDQWFGDPLRDPEDWVVFYYTGHAEIVGADSLFLLTSDFHDNFYTSTAFDFQKLASVLLTPGRGGRPRRVKNLLIILDTCFAGQGISELYDKLKLAFRKGFGDSFNFLSAALPKQEAQAGALAKALIAAIETLSTRNVTQQYLYLDEIYPQIATNLRKIGIQDAMRITGDSRGDLSQFFPNRNFVNTGGKPVAASDAQRAISDQEFREHWGPRARGVEFDGQPGFYFSGRTVVLDKLTAYLNDRDDKKACIITGGPGSGKSAILSRLLTISVPALRSKWVSPGVGPLVPPFDFVFHAKGRTLRDATSRLSEVLEVDPSKEAILDAVKRSKKQIRIMVDALDESAEPSLLAKELLNPLASIDSVKLLVGTRASELSAFPGAEVLDIDRPEHARVDDVVAYVRTRLLKSDDPEQRALYAGNEELVNGIAKSVADRAYPNFLVARLVVEDLLSRDKPVNPNDPFGPSFPANVASAFSLYLSRFGTDETAVRDLLLPLAYARGQGLPWDNIWAPLASTLSRRTNSGRDYSDQDIRWLLTHAGAFILETTENGRSVYRLFHQALADTLRVKESTKQIESSYAEALAATIPQWSTTSETREIERPDWPLANRYIRSYLSVHADAGGILGSFLEDPLFVLAADPHRLLAIFAESTESYPRSITGVYRDVVHQILTQPISIAAAYLEMVARKRQLPEFADKIAQLPVNRAWEIPWARWTPPAASRSFGASEQEIHCLRTGTLADGRRVALLGSETGAVEVWDITRGEIICRWTPDGLRWVEELSLVQMDGNDVIVAAWHDGELGTFNIASDKHMIRLPQDRGNDHAVVTALCIANSQGQPVCVTAHADDHLAMWKLPDLQPLRQKSRAGAIYKLQVVAVAGKTLLLAAGDSQGDSDELGQDVEWTETSQLISALRLLAVDDLSLVWEDATDQEGYFSTICRADYFGRSLVAGYREGPREVQVWDLDSSRCILNLPLQSAKRCWLYQFRGDVLLVWQGSGRLGAKRLVAAVEEDRLSLRAEDFGATVKVWGKSFTEIIFVQSRAVILSTVLNNVHVWNLDDLLQELLSEHDSGKELEDVPDYSRVTVLRAVSRIPLEFYAGSMGKIIAANASDGAVLWEKELESEGSIKQIAQGAASNELVVADDAGSIHILDCAARGATL